MGIAKDQRKITHTCTHHTHTHTHHNILTMHQKHLVEYGSSQKPYVHLLCTTNDDEIAVVNLIITDQQISTEQRLYKHKHTHTHSHTHNILTSTVQWMKYFLSLEMHKASLGCSLQILPDVVRDSSETIVRNDANFIAQPECLFVSHSNHWCIHMHNNMLFLARAITQIECYQKLQQLLLKLLYWAIYPTEILGSIACVYPPQPFAPISWYVLTYMWFTRDTVL